MFKNLSLIVVFCFVAFTFGCSSATSSKPGDIEKINTAETQKTKELDTKAMAGDGSQDAGDVGGASIGGKGTPKKPNPGAPPN